MREAPPGPELIFSLPGEWIDRYGRVRPRVAVRRIIVVKVDHIGDLLIAARAFELLRHFFPRAHIDLICGPWNVELARRLGIFDDVRGLSLFHQFGGQQTNPEIARAVRRAGIRQLEELTLGSYDLAIDMRHDPDSRTILPSVDARIYAGFGTSRVFPFLDIALPMEDPAPASDQAHDLVFGRKQFHRVVEAIDETVPRGQGSGAISSVKAAIAVDLVVEGARSPVECGTSQEDMRQLGVALVKVTVTPLRHGEAAAQGWLPLSLRAPHRDLALISGWAGPEEWGVWGVGDLSRLRIHLPPSSGETHVRLDLELRGHVNAGNPLVSCALQGDFDPPPEAVHFNTVEYQQQVTLTTPRHEQRVKLGSEPFSLGPGEYEGLLRLYLPMEIRFGMALGLTLREVESGAVLMRRRADAAALRTGLCEIGFQCRIDIGGRSLSFEVEAESAADFEGAHIDMLTLRCIRRLKINVPPSHNENRLCMLVMRVALEFSQEPFFVANSIAARLTAPPSNPSAADAAIQTLRAQIMDWKAEGHCVIGIALGAGKELKKWPRHYFVELAKGLLELGGVRLLFIGGPGDREDAAVACAELGLDAETHAKCGAVPLAELGRVLQPLDLFIGNDTGTTHFAGRVGVRTIAIFSGCTHPREWGPIGDHVSWLYRDEDCAPCYLAEITECGYGHVCIRNLLPTGVAAIVIPEVLGVLSARQVGKGSSA